MKWRSKHGSRRKRSLQKLVVAAPERRVVQFQSYPWWTDVQKEERAIAASVLSKHVAPRGLNVPKPQDFDALPNTKLRLNKPNRT